MLYWFSHIITWISHKYTCASPMWTSLPPGPRPTPLGCHRALGWLNSLWYTAIPHWLSYIYIMCLFQCSSLFIPPSLFPAVYTKSVPYVCILFLPCKQVHQYHFSRLHIYALIYDISFCLFDIFHPIWQALGSSASLELIQVCSFIWLSNIALYLCTTTSLSIHPMDI